MRNPVVRPLPAGRRPRATCAPETLEATKPAAHSAFTLLELLAVVAILGLFAALASAALARAVDQARAAQCLSNLRVLGGACMGYAADNNLTLPVTTHQRRSGLKSWTLSLQPYAGGTLSFRCPSDEVRDRAYTYVLNDFLTPHPAGAADLDYSRLARLGTPSATLLFGEASKNHQNSDHFHFAEYVGQSLPPAFFEAQVATGRHLGAANYLFADGHVENITAKRVREILGEPGSPFVDPTASAH